MIALVLGLAVGYLPIAWIGLAPRRDSPPVTTPWVPFAAPVAVLAVLLSPTVGFLGALLFMAAKQLRAAVRSVRQHRSKAAALPDTLEMIFMAISAGMPINDMVSLVAHCGPPPLRPLFASAQRSLAAGQSRRDVLRQLASEGGSQLAAVAEVLIAADRDGASVALVLDRLAAEAGRARRLAAEERTRRAPVLMLAPLTLCCLPAVLIGTVVPFVLLSFGQTSF